MKIASILRPLSKAMSILKEGNEIKTENPPIKINVNMYITTTTYCFMYPPSLPEHLVGLVGPRQSQASRLPKKKGGVRRNQEPGPSWGTIRGVLELASTSAGSLPLISSPSSTKKAATPTQHQSQSVIRASAVTAGPAGRCAHNQGRPPDTSSGNTRGCTRQGDI